MCGRTVRHCTEVIGVPLTHRYCLKEGYGTRLIPSGTINGAHFVKVVSDKVSYVQVTGSGDVSGPDVGLCSARADGQLTKLLIPAGDDGGELDVSCAFEMT